MRIGPVVALFVLACTGPGSEADRLAPREEFHWTEQSISFEPPPSGWRREGELSGGVKGVRFVKERSVGEAITIGEVHAIGERDRTAAIQEILDKLGDKDRYTVEWTTERNGYHYVNRDIYFMHDSHLFVARFIGLETSVPLFERVVASIKFPE